MTSKRRSLINLLSLSYLSKSISKSLLITILLTKKSKFHIYFLEKHLCHQKGDKKLHITQYYSYFDFSRCC